MGRDDAAFGAVVLAGGRSTRMGQPKVDLEWHGSTLLRRVTGLALRSVEGPVVVVRAPGQQLPELPAAVRVVEDAEQGRGPLQGVATGLAALEGETAAAFVCATDLPFLHPAYVRRVTRALAGHDIALPVVGGYRQPLAAAYRTALAERAADLLREGRSRVGQLAEGSDVRLLEEQDLLEDPRVRDLDPQLDSVAGVNDRQEYDLARARPAPEVVVERFGVAAGGRGTSSVRAATLGAAALAVGLELDRHLLAALDGDQVVRDVQTPLVQGDRVTFLSADAGG